MITHIGNTKRVWRINNERILRKLILTHSIHHYLCHMLYDYCFSQHMTCIGEKATIIDIKT